MKFKKAQKNIYNHSWSEYSWRGEKLYPTMVSLDLVYSRSTAQKNMRYPALKNNVLGAPRSGTKWLHKIVKRVLKTKKNLHLFFKNERVRHAHEAVIEDFKVDQNIFFIYRDVRDSIVSGYFYIKNGLHEGTMGCTTNAFRSMSKEEGITRQITMYMKYRVPFINYWMSIKDDRVVKIKYEDLVAQPNPHIEKIAEKNSVTLERNKINNIKKDISFKHMTDGRKRGVENRKSHLRKGIHGDWKNHFTKKHVEIFETMGGNTLLSDLGYKI